VFTKILNTYQFESVKDLFFSVFPTAKYHLFLEVTLISSFAAMCELVFGFKLIVLVAFVFCASLEFVSGVIASVFVKKESFESTKAFRFVFKAAILLGVLFITNTFSKGYPGDNSLMSDCMKWLYGFLFAVGALEYLTSIIENYAVINGKEKSYYIDKIRNGLNIFK
jgi:hypothetical protein